MSFLFNNQVTFVAKDVDSSGRLRVATPLTLFEHNNQFGTNPFKWDTQTVGTGTLVDSVLTTTNSTVLSTGGLLINAASIRATRQNFRYQVGKSLYLGMSFLFGSGVTGVSKKIGYFDANNGVFLEQNGTTINITVRNGGVDVATPSTSWNVDKLDGSGPSGITFNPLGVQDFRIDFFGSFGMRFYFYYNGTFNLVHSIENSNVTSPPPIPGAATLNLPLRQEIVNLSAVLSIGTLTVFHANLMSEGAVEVFPAFNFSGSNGTTTISVSTRRPVLSIQAKTLGPAGSLRNYGTITPEQFSIYGANPLFYEVVLNGSLTGASFSSVASTSLTNVDTSATAISGGIVLLSGYAGAGGGAGAQAAFVNQLFQKFPMVYSSLLNTQDVVSIVCTSIGAAAATSATIAWTEYY